MDSPFRDILKRYWGFDDFRGIQREIIESIASGHDTLGLMPTGGGKSVTFQVPALAQPGLCLVVTPLISLMKDQVRNLRRRGIKAAAVYSGMTRGEIETALDNCIFGGYKFLYVSPERMMTQLFLAKFRAMEISFLTVDESHCISQWGYDFRPSYLRIAELRALHPGAPVLALTATATPAVVDDIQEKLRFRPGAQVFRMSFERKGLAYVVRPCPDKQTELLHILKHTGGSAIVYARSRKKTKETAAYLRDQGISAAHYHAGLPHETKDRLQEEWHHDAFRVMVATNAFGMGIDKPDVRLVVHIDVPDSLEAYFQEAGRAGRDGRKAYAVLLYQPTDVAGLWRQLSISYPPKDYLREVYEKVCFYLQVAMGYGSGRNFDFDTEEFCRRFHFHPATAESALRLLAQAGYIDYEDEPDNASRLHFLLPRDALYGLDLPEESDRLMQLVLRTYPGLFSDYAFISEERLAATLGLTRQAVYEDLTGLDRRGIVHYVPRKRTPLLAFRTDRLPPGKLQFPPAIYEERIRQAERRIEAMADYISSTDTCRQQLLLAYFGQKHAPACGQCDVCLARSSGRAPREGATEAAAEAVLRLLRTEGPLPLLQLADRLPRIRREDLARALTFLLDERHAVYSDGILTAKS